MNVNTSQVSQTDEETNAIWEVNAFHLLTPKDEKKHRINSKIRVLTSIWENKLPEKNEETFLFPPIISTSLDLLASPTSPTQSISSMSSTSPTSSISPISPKVGEIPVPNFLFSDGFDFLDNAASFWEVMTLTDTIIPTTQHLGEIHIDCLDFNSSYPINIRDNDSLDRNAFQNELSLNLSAIPTAIEELNVKRSSVTTNGIDLPLSQIDISTSSRPEDNESKFLDNPPSSETDIFFGLSDHTTQAAGSTNTQFLDLNMVHSLEPSRIKGASFNENRSELFREKDTTISPPKSMPYLNHEAILHNTAVNHKEIEELYLLSLLACDDFSTINNRLYCDTTAFNSTRNFIDINCRPLNRNQSLVHHQHNISGRYRAGTPVNPSISLLKRRRRLSVEESNFLLRHFLKDKRPNSHEREMIAKQLKLDKRTIQIWFQNRRAKLRRVERGEN